MWYIEENGNPVPCADVLAASKWLYGPGGEERRRVRETKIGDDNVWVSTVFLGLDHNYFGGRPLLYETMIFGGPHDLYQSRYSTKEEAIAGHDEAVLLATSPTEEKDQRK